MADAFIQLSTEDFSGPVYDDDVYPFLYRRRVDGVDGEVAYEYQWAVLVASKNTMVRQFLRELGFREVPPTLEDHKDGPPGVWHFYAIPRNGVLRSFWSGDENLWEDDQNDPTPLDKYVELGTLTGDVILRPVILRPDAITIKLPNIESDQVNATASVGMRSMRFTSGDRQEFWFGFEKGPALDDGEVIDDVEDLEDEEDQYEVSAGFSIVLETERDVKIGSGKSISQESRAVTIAHHGGWGGQLIVEGTVVPYARRPGESLRLVVDDASAFVLTGDPPDELLRFECDLSDDTPELPWGKLDLKRGKRKLPAFSLNRRNLRIGFSRTGHEVFARPDAPGRDIGVSFAFPLILAREKSDPFSDEDELLVEAVDEVGELVNDLLGFGLSLRLPVDWDPDTDAVASLLSTRPTIEFFGKKLARAEVLIDNIETNKAARLTSFFSSLTKLTGSKGSGFGTQLVAEATNFLQRCELQSLCLPLNAEVRYDKDNDFKLATSIPVDLTGTVPRLKLNNVYAYYTFTDQPEGKDSTQLVDFEFMEIELPKRVRPKTSTIAPQASKDDWDVCLNFEKSELMINAGDPPEGGPPRTRKKINLHFPGGLPKSGKARQKALKKRFGLTLKDFAPDSWPNPAAEGEPNLMLRVGPSGVSFRAEINEDKVIVADAGEDDRLIDSVEIEPVKERNGVKSRIVVIDSQFRDALVHGNTFVPGVKNLLAHVVVALRQEREGAPPKVLAGVQLARPDETPIAEFSIGALQMRLQEITMVLEWASRREWDFTAIADGEISFTPDADIVDDLRQLQNPSSIKVQGLDLMRLNLKTARVELALTDPVQFDILDGLIGCRLEGLSFEWEGKRPRLFHSDKASFWYKQEGVAQITLYAGDLNIYFDDGGRAHVEVPPKVGIDARIGGEAVKFKGEIGSIEEPDGFYMFAGGSLGLEGFPEAKALLLLGSQNKSSRQPATNLVIFGQKDFDFEIFSGVVVKSLGGGVGYNRRLVGIRPNPDANEILRNIDLIKPEEEASWNFVREDGLYVSIIAAAELASNQGGLDMQNAYVASLILSIDTNFDIVAAGKLWLACSVKKARENPNNPVLIGALAISPRNSRLEAVLESRPNPATENQQLKALLNKGKVRMSFRMAPGLVDYYLEEVSYRERMFGFDAEISGSFRMAIFVPRVLIRASITLVGRIDKPLRLGPAGADIRGDLRVALEYGGLLQPSGMQVFAGINASLSFRASAFLKVEIKFRIFGKTKRIGKTFRKTFGGLEIGLRGDIALTTSGELGAAGSAFIPISICGYRRNIEPRVEFRPGVISDVRGQVAAVERDLNEFIRRGRAKRLGFDKTTMDTETLGFDVASLPEQSPPVEFWMHYSTTSPENGRIHHALLPETGAPWLTPRIHVARRKTIAGVRKHDGQEVVVETTEPHKLRDDDQIVVEGVRNYASVNRGWAVKVKDTREVRLQGSSQLVPPGGDAGGGRWRFSDTSPFPPLLGHVRTIRVYHANPHNGHNVKNVIRNETGHPVVLALTGQDVVDGDFIVIFDAIWNRPLNTRWKIAADGEKVTLVGSEGNDQRWDEWNQVGRWFWFGHAIGNVVQNDIAHPVVLEVEPGHGLEEGDTITIFDTCWNPSLNGEWEVAVDANRITLLGSEGNDVPWERSGGWYKSNDFITRQDGPTKNVVTLFTPWEREHWRRPDWVDAPQEAELERLQGLFVATADSSDDDLGRWIRDEYRTEGIKIYSNPWVETTSRQWWREEDKLTLPEGIYPIDSRPIDELEVAETNNTKRNDASLNDTQRLIAFHNAQRRVARVKRHSVGDANEVEALSQKQSDMVNMIVEDLVQTFQSREFGPRARNAQGDEILGLSFDLPEEHRPLFVEIKRGPNALGGDETTPKVVLRAPDEDVELRAGSQQSLVAKIDRLPGRQKFVVTRAAENGQGETAKVLVKLPLKFDESLLSDESPNLGYFEIYRRIGNGPLERLPGQYRPGIEVLREQNSERRAETALIVNPYIATDEFELNDRQFANEQIKPGETEIHYSFRVIPTATNTAEEQTALDNSRAAPWAPIKLHVPEPDPFPADLAIVFGVHNLVRSGGTDGFVLDNTQLPGAFRMVSFGAESPQLAHYGDRPLRAGDFELWAQQIDLPQAGYFGRGQEAEPERRIDKSTAHLGLVDPEALHQSTDGKFRLPFRPDERDPALMLIENLDQFKFGYSYRFFVRPTRLAEINLIKPLKVFFGRKLPGEFSGSTALRPAYDDLVEWIPPEVADRIRRNEVVLLENFSVNDFFQAGQNKLRVFWWDSLNSLDGGVELVFSDRDESSLEQRPLCEVLSDRAFRESRRDFADDSSWSLAEHQLDDRVPGCTTSRLSSDKDEEDELVNFFWDPKAVDTNPVVRTVNENAKHLIGTLDKYFTGLVDWKTVLLPSLYDFIGSVRLFERTPLNLNEPHYRQLSGALTECLRAVLLGTRSTTARFRTTVTGEPATVMEFHGNIATATITEGDLIQFVSGKNANLIRSVESIRDETKITVSRPWQAIPAKGDEFVVSSALPATADAFRHLEQETMERVRTVEEIDVTGDLSPDEETDADLALQLAGYIRRRVACADDVVWLEELDDPSDFPDVAFGPERKSRDARSEPLPRHHDWGEREADFGEFGPHLPHTSTLLQNFPHDRAGRDGAVVLKFVTEEIQRHVTVSRGSVDDERKQKIAAVVPRAAKLVALLEALDPPGEASEVEVIKRPHHQLMTDVNEDGETVAVATPAGAFLPDGVRAHQGSGPPPLPAETTTRTLQETQRVLVAGNGNAALMTTARAGSIGSFQEFQLLPGQPASWSSLDLIHAEGRQLAVVCERYHVADDFCQVARVFDLPSGQVIREFDALSEEARCGAVFARLPEGLRMLTAEVSGGRPVVFIRNPEAEKSGDDPQLVQSKDELEIPEEQEQRFTCLDYDSRSRFALAGTVSGTVFVWSATTRQRETTLQHDPARGPVVDAKFVHLPTGLHILTAGQNGRIRLWGLSEEPLLGGLTKAVNETETTILVKLEPNTTAPDNGSLIRIGDEIIKVTDAQTWTTDAQTWTVERRVNGVQATHEKDDKIRRHRPLDDGFDASAPITNIAYDPRRRSLAAGTETRNARNVCVWKNVFDSSNRTRWSHSADASQTVVDFAVLSKKTGLVSAGNDGTSYWWDFWDLAFNPDEPDPDHRKVVRELSSTPGDYKPALAVARMPVVTSTLSRSVVGFFNLLERFGFAVDLALVNSSNQLLSADEIERRIETHLTTLRNSDKLLGDNHYVFVLTAREPDSDYRRANGKDESIGHSFVKLAVVPKPFHELCLNNGELFRANVVGANGNLITLAHPIPSVKGEYAYEDKKVAVTHGEGRGQAFRLTEIFQPKLNRALEKEAPGTVQAINVIDSDNAPAAPFLVRIDEELMEVRNTNDATWDVVRGAQDTLPGRHTTATRIHLADGVQFSVDGTWDPLPADGAQAVVYDPDWLREIRKWYEQRHIELGRSDAEALITLLHVREMARYVGRPAADAKYLRLVIEQRGHRWPTVPDLGGRSRTVWPVPDSKGHRFQVAVRKVSRYEPLLHWAAGIRKPVPIPPRRTHAGEFAAVGRAVLDPDVAAAASGDVQQITVRDAIDLPAAPFLVRLDVELMRVQEVEGTTWTVVRGADNTRALEHRSGTQIFVANVATLSDDASTDPYAYNGQLIEVIASSGASQLDPVAKYHVQSLGGGRFRREVRVEQAWIESPSAGTQYRILKRGWVDRHVPPIMNAARGEGTRPLHVSGYQHPTKVRFSYQIPPDGARSIYNQISAIRTGYRGCEMAFRYELVDREQTLDKILSAIRPRGGVPPQAELRVQPIVFNKSGDPHLYRHERLVTLEDLPFHQRYYLDARAVYEGRYLNEEELEAGLMFPQGEGLAPFVEREPAQIGVARPTIRFGARLAEVRVEPHMDDGATVGRAVLDHGVAAAARGDVQQITVRDVIDLPTAPFLVRVGAELMQVQQVERTTWTIKRGVDGTQPLEHALGSEIRVVNEVIREVKLDRNIPEDFGGFGDPTKPAWVLFEVFENGGYRIARRHRITSFNEDARVAGIDPVWRASEAMGTWYIGQAYYVVTIVLSKNSDHLTEFERDASPPTLFKEVPRNDDVLRKVPAVQLPDLAMSYDIRWRVESGDESSEESGATPGEPVFLPALSALLPWAPSYTDHATKPHDLEPFMKYGSIRINDPPDPDHTGTHLTIKVYPGDLTTTLAGAIDDARKQLHVLDACVAPKCEFFIQINAEIMHVTATERQVWTVRRAQAGTLTASHAQGDAVRLANVNPIYFLDFGFEVKFNEDEEGPKSPSTFWDPTQYYLRAAHGKRNARSIRFVVDSPLQRDEVAASIDDLSDERVADGGVATEQPISEDIPPKDKPRRRWF